MPVSQAESSVTREAWWASRHPGRVIGQDVCLELSWRPCAARVWRCLNVMEGTFQVGQNVCLKPVGTSYNSRREERLNVVA